jgi:hypothetical protein
MIKLEPNYIIDMVNGVAEDGMVLSVFLPRVLPDFKVLNSNELEVFVENLIEMVSRKVFRNSNKSLEGYVIAECESHQSSFPAFHLVFKKPNRMWSDYFRGDLEAVANRLNHCNFTFDRDCERRISPELAEFGHTHLARASRLDRRNIKLVTKGLLVKPEPTAQFYVLDGREFSFERLRLDVNKSKPSARGSNRMERLAVNA